MVKKSELGQRFGLIPALEVCFIILFCFLRGAAGSPQDQLPPTTAPESGSSLRAAPAQGTTPLAKLLEEAERNNPQYRAAYHAWRASTQIPSQASTLPDPQFVIQQLNVGSPRPFAGFTNSDFAYLGVGVSQDLPYPGKLRLKGEMAQRDAAAAREHLQSALRSVIEQLKTAYFQLAYELEALAIVERNGKLLDQVEKIANARYRVGQGNQQDVLKAQLQQTRLLREAAMHHQEHWRLQAQLKQILNRPPGSPDITPEQLVETPLNYTVDELLERVRTQNPDVRTQEEMIRRQGLELELAHKDFYPDFNVQYMWQHTAEQFRDYHMLSFGVRIPVHRGRKLRPEVAGAAEELSRARREYEARTQQAYFDVRDQFVAADTSAQLLKIYREGLIPQATATYDAGLAAYQASREDFETLLGSFLDVLNLDIEYWRTLADHEIALAGIERVTGVTFR
jgi:outer membrane protein TolC